MSVHLERKALINTQQMEVAVNGPDGATHLILCTSIAILCSVSHKTYTFLVGPRLARRQFVGAIAPGALARIQVCHKDPVAEKAYVKSKANLVSIDAKYDDECSQVKIRAEVAANSELTRLAISYNVSILAELPIP